MVLTMASCFIRAFHTTQEYRRTFTRVRGQKTLRRLDIFTVCRLGFPRKKLAGNFVETPGRFSNRATDRGELIRKASRNYRGTIRPG